MARTKNVFGGRPSAGPIAGRDLELYLAIHNYKVPVPVRLRLSLFRTESATRPAGQADIAEYVARLINASNTTLAPHGMSLDLLPAQPSGAGAKAAMTPLPYDRTVDIPSADVNTVRTQANAAVYVAGRLPVIVCPLRNARKDDPRGAYGVTMGIEPGQTGPIWVYGAHWLPFILINSADIDSDGQTLLHEIGHSARLDHEESRGSELNFMNTSGNARDTSGKLRPRTEMSCCQVMKLASAYFADPVWMPPPDQKRRCPWTDSCRNYDLRPHEPVS